MMPYAQSIVMRRRLHNPTLYKIRGIVAENASRVGVACRRNFAFLRKSFTYDKFEFAVVCLCDAEHGDRSFFEFKFNRRAAALFAVEFFQTAQYGFSFGNCHMVRPVMTYEYAVCVKVERVKLRKTSAYAESVHYQHRYACFHVVFAAHGYSLRIQN